jgi:hypothetical protein
MKFKYLFKTLIGITIGYGILYTIAKIFFNFFFPLKEITTKIYSNSDAFNILPLFITSCLLVSTIIIYLFNSWLGGKWIHFKWPQVLLYMGVMAGIGPTAEIFINSIWRLLTDQPLWLYQFLPVHGGDTSLVMSVIWPIYGFHIYCFHQALKARHDKTTDIDMALLFGIDAITLEVIANLFAISFFYSYIFYYFAGDLEHLITAVAFIPYLVIKTLHIFEKKHHRILFGIFGFLWSWILIFVL